MMALSYWGITLITFISEKGKKRMRRTMDKKVSNPVHAVVIAPDGGNSSGRLSLLPVGDKSTSKGEKQE